MSGFIDSQEIDIPCENCSRKTKKSIGWIKSHNDFTCACGAHIKIDANKFKTEIANVDRSIASLQKSLKNIGK